MDFYYHEMSPPSRAVIITARMLGTNLNLKRVDLMKRENLGEQYAKINFQKVVPTLVEGDFILGESRAIMIYLAEKDNAGEKIYHKDTKSRALINSRLFFEQTMYQNFMNFYYPQIFSRKPADPEKHALFEKSLEHLETFLGSSKYVAGDRLTVADITFFTSCSTFKISAGIDLTKFTNISRWYEDCLSVLPETEFDRQGAEKFKALFDRMKQ